MRKDQDLATVTRDEHMAVIRRWRGLRSLHAGNPAMADVCIRVMEQRYESTENEFIADQLHALSGAWLVEQGKFAEAIPELEQANDDAFSLELLARARRQSGDATGADAALRQLLAIHSSTMDAVLVVEPARQKSAVSSTASVSK
jgi:predicted Zn-dependent protease